MRLQAVLSNTLGIGEVGLHRANPRRSHFGGFLDDEVGTGLLDWREQQPQVGRVFLGRRLRRADQRAAAFARLDHLGLPFAITPVEQRHNAAHPQPHDRKQILRLRLRQRDGLPRVQRLVYIQSDFRTLHGGEHMVAPPPMPEQTPPATGEVADAVGGNWVDSHAPAWSRPYLRLSRADRPIGTWLLLIPCWWGLLLASATTGRFGLFDLWIAVGCAMGAFLMRGAGCTWNDITDHKIDASVARTRSRPIPSGQTSVRKSLVWMAVQALAALAILLSFPPAAILLGFASLIPVAIYPFAKRFTWWPQVFLGLAFNWGALLAWTAHTGALGLPAVILYVGGIVWTLFYDTIYAHQDIEDDALIGVKSTARLFGDSSRNWLRGFLAATVCLLALAVIAALAPLQTPMAMVLGLGGVWAMGWHMAWLLRNLDEGDPKSCMLTFRRCRDTGLILAGFLVLACVAW
ncbi:MAG: 4-hydroxybenzoate octaprenyltransferase [Rhodobacteraceae bacterium]|nr:4-hydroxybenzoate octaprenyltransferase [Paracoccaceae bacterium]